MTDYIYVRNNVYFSFVMLEEEEEGDAIRDLLHNNLFAFHSLVGNRESKSKREVEGKGGGVRESKREVEGGREEGWSSEIMKWKRLCVGEVSSVVMSILVYEYFHRF